MLRYGKAIKVLAACLVLIVLAVGCTTKSDTSKLEGDVVAVVNGAEISKDQFNKNLALFKMDYVNQFGEEMLNEDMGSGMTLLETIKEQVMEKLVMEELLMQLAKENKIEVSDEEIQKSYDEYLVYVKGNEDFKTFADENGIDEDFIKGEIKKDRSITAYQEHYIKELGMDEAQAKKYYDENPDFFINDEVKARHILVSDEELAKQLVNRIKAGESFEELAKEYSEDPGSKDKGGDLDYFPKGVMIAEFEEAAFSMEIGAVSEPVATMFGFHIIKVEDKRSEKKDFEEIKAALVQELEIKDFQKYVEERLEESKVTKNMPQEEEEKKEE
ncbi:peptidylprolyl isomerase [Alkaliphilus hydrothermalis]|nr:peptidylprolyl isomerase [Alkaliphilus hydrothermalis]